MLMCMLALRGDTVMHTDADSAGDSCRCMMLCVPMRCAGGNVMLYDEWWVNGPNDGLFGLSAQRVDGLRQDS